MTSVLASLIDILTAGIVDAIAGAMVVLFSVFIVPRRLWRLHGAHRPGGLKIVVSYREPEETSAYALPVTGIGQLLAVGALASSLVRSYGWRWREPFTIKPGNGPVDPSNLSGNLILLGGTSRNEVTRAALNRCGEAIGVKQEFKDAELYGDRLFLREEDGSWTAFGGTPPSAEGEQGQIREDYALILRMRNPWDGDPRKQCVIFSGVHTYGTAAAASYFVRQWWKPAWWRRAGIVALIRVKVDDGHVVGTERVLLRRLTREQTRLFADPTDVALKQP